MEENNPQDFDFSTKALERDKVGPSTDKPDDEENKEEKPKYNKSNDFFDTLTNSTLEPRDTTRGGRGRGRGDRGRGDFRGGRGG